MFKHTHTLSPGIENTTTETGEVNFYFHRSTVDQVFFCHLKKGAYPEIWHLFCIVRLAIFCTFDAFGS